MNLGTIRRKLDSIENIAHSMQSEFEDEHGLIALLLEDLASVREAIEPPKNNFSKTKAKINNVSPKRQEENRKYLDKRKTFLENHSICQCSECDNASTDVHHKKKRNGQRLLDEKYWMAVCRTCHKQITENPEWAFEMGYCFKVNTVESNLIEDAISYSTWLEKENLDA